MVYENVLPIIAGMLVACLVCQWMAWRIKLPAIIFLLLAGIMAGAISGHLDPERLMGHLFFPFVSISVAVILFEGSLTLRFSEILGLESVVRNLVSIGMVDNLFAFRSEGPGIEIGLQLVGAQRGCRVL